MPTQRVKFNLFLAFFLLCVLFAAGRATDARAETPEISDVVNFDIQVSREVPNDLMRASVSAQNEDRDPASAADAVNRQVAAALAKAKQFPAVTVQSGGYQTFPIYDQTRIAAWRAQNEIRLESRDFAQLSKLLGQLQESMQMSNLEFAVSPTARAAAEESLTTEGINAFKQRAELIRRAYKAESYRIRQMDIHSADRGGIIRPQRMAAMEMAVKSVAPPPAEPGSSIVTLTVSGSIQLR